MLCRPRKRVANYFRGNYIVRSSAGKYAAWLRFDADQPFYIQPEVVHEILALFNLLLPRLHYFSAHKTSGGRYPMRVVLDIECLIKVDLGS